MRLLHFWMKKAKRADKPGSVVDDHLSRLHVTVQFFARYPSAGRADPWRSYSRLLRKGLAKPPCCHDAGGLLHHRFSFSLTRHKTSSGSLLFCGANPSGCPAWPLASFLPYGARTFLTGGLSACPRGCPACLRIYFTQFRFPCQSQQRNFKILSRAAWRMAILQKAFLLNADRPIWLCHFTRIVIQEKGHLSLFTLYIYHLFFLTAPCES